MKRHILIIMILLAACTAMAQSHVSDLVVTPSSGGTIKWYTASSGPNEITSPSTTDLVDGTTYYASQTVNGVESTARLAITVTVNTAITYYRDADGDNYGNLSVTESNCTGASIGYVTNSTDCDDTNAAIHPVNVAAIAGGAASVCVGSTTPAFTDPTSGGTWSIIAGTGNASIDVSGVVTGLTAGTVTVKYSNPSLWCESAAISSLTINDLPNPIIIGEQNPAESDITDYSVDNVVGHTYSWTFTGNGVIITPTTGNAIRVSFGVGVGNTGTLNVTETITETNCSKAATPLTTTTVPY